MAAFHSRPVLAGVISAPPAPKTVLTVSRLEERIATPVRQSGATVIDLRGFIIDLRPPDSPEIKNVSKGASDFSAQFYQQLQNSLNAKASGSSTPMGLDISNSLIQGELDLARLGLRIPAYGDAVLPALKAFNQSFQPQAASGLSAQRRFSITNELTDYSSSFGSATVALSKFLITPAQPPPLDSVVIQGPLFLRGTCFNGPLIATNLYFLDRVEAAGAIFTQTASWQGARFAKQVSFEQSQFQQESSFRLALFAQRSRFAQTLFAGDSNWQGSLFFEGNSFAQASFGAVNFSRAHWQANADFDRATFRDYANFQKSRFDEALFLSEAQVEGPLNFRQAQFQQPVSLRGAHILNQVDFGDARFALDSAINVADLDFSAATAKILGSPGYIGQRFSLPTLSGNETVLRNLVRNFRLLEQIVDANQLEYTTEQLRLTKLKRQMLGTGINQASLQQLEKLGFSAEQATAIANHVSDRPFVSRTDLLTLDEIDLATYLKVRDRITTTTTDPLSRIQHFIHWALLASLLLLSQYGTNVGLIFSVGLLATTAFAIMFWLIDRVRRKTPTAILPTKSESVAIALGSSTLLALGLSLLTQSSPHPVQTLAAVGVFVLPVPTILIGMLYKQGRFHDLMDTSYFVENGALRRLQVLIARLPIIPKYPFFRDRYGPISSDRSWNWLNYFDFSFNNWFKFGFNDIRLREKAVPGLISALVWYQWSLGVIFIILLLWTLSRTIPGLNLLLYF
ncbi:MAG: pentapeptide repeat-containing protein [Cyanobacteria bacterium J06643_4]